MNSAPIVTLVDVWETSLTIRVEQPRAVGSEGRPVRWEISVLSGERILRNTQIEALALVETVRIDRGLESVRSVVIEVRGIGREVGEHGPVSKLPVELLPRPSMSQCSIHPNQLDLHWIYEGFVTPLVSLISTVQVGVSSDEFTIREGEYLHQVSCAATDSQLQGSMQVYLPPHLVQEETNFCVFGRVRCQSSTTGEWGTWSPKRRLFCLSNLSVSIESVSSQGVLFVWERTEGIIHQTGGALISEDDAAIERFEVSMWPATHKSQQQKKRGADDCQPVPRTVVSDQTRVFGVNTTEVSELLPNTVYNVCTRWLQSCGGTWHAKYFRVATQPEPHIVGIPRIGASFVEVEWSVAPKQGDVSLDGLADYLDEELTPGMPHSPNYTLMTHSEASRLTRCDLHRLTVWSCGDVIKTVDVEHNPLNSVQRLVINSLPSGTPIRIWVTSALKYVLPIINVPQWSWGKSSAPKVVVTVSDLRLVPQHRGPNFMVLTLGCDPPEPVRVLESDFFTSVDTSIAPPVFVCPRTGIYTLQVSSTRRNNPTSLSVSSHSATSPQVCSGEVSLQSQNVLQLRDLSPNTEYDLRVEVIDDEGIAGVQQRLGFSTISEDLLYVRPYTRPGPEHGVAIDQHFHDANQPKCEDSEVRYLTEVGEIRQKELAAIVAMGPSRVDSISLRTGVVSLGSDHAILEWCAYSTKPEEGAVAVSIFAESSKQHAIAFNTTPKAMREYRVRVAVSPLQSTVIEAGRAVAETSKELYFRSAVRLTKLVGLQEGYKYRVVMSYFNVGSQKWSPWSTPLLLRPADRLSIHAPLITPTCITIHWKKNTSLDVDGVGEMPMQHVSYELVVTHSTGESHTETGLTTTSFAYRNVLSGTIKFQVRPCFEDGSTGPYSAPFCVAIVPLKVTCTSVSQTSTGLSWSLPEDLTYLEHRRGVVTLRVASSPPPTVRSEEYSPLTTSTIMEHLKPSTTYTISGTYLVEVHPLSTEAKFDDVDPMRLVTLDPVCVTVEAVGEDYAIVRWRRINVDPTGQPQEQNAPILSVASPLRSPLPRSAASSTKGITERYEVSVFDGEFGHINTDLASVSRLSGLVLQRKIKNLLPGCIYRVSVKLANLGGCKPLEVVFRTRGTLQLEPSYVPDQNVWRCDFKRESLEVGPLPHKLTNHHTPSIHSAPNPPTPLIFPIEAMLEEVASAPKPQLNGDRAAIHHAGFHKACYSKRVFTTSTDEAAIFRGVPSHVSHLRFSARQQSLNGDWLAWSYRLVEVPSSPHQHADQL